MFYLYLDTVKDKLNITPLYTQVLNRAKLGTLRLRVRLNLRDRNTRKITSNSSEAV